MDTKVSILTCVRLVKTFKKSEWISHSNTPEEINHREKSIINVVMEELGMFYYTISGCSQLLWEKKIASIPWYLNPLNQDLRAQPHDFACVFSINSNLLNQISDCGFWDQYSEGNPTSPAQNIHLFDGMACASPI